MYDYIWDNESGGYLLTTRTGRFVANEIRPVFAEELQLLGMNDRFFYDVNEPCPYMWAQKNQYYYQGEKVAQCNNTRYGQPISIEYFFEGIKELRPVDIACMVRKNEGIMQAVVSDAKRRTKELYDADIARCDTAYIAFSGGKDSVALLHLCNDVLPQDIPVIFSDTDMELPDTYVTWEVIQKRYPLRTFICAKAETHALDNWEIMGPPSRTIRWCCSIHKSTPALINLKRILARDAVRVMAFVGVRGEESISRSFYEDVNDGVKNASQMNRMPLLDWGAHELWLYIFANDLYVNHAYKMGLPRIGCAMCPESSDKYVWLVNAAYPGLVNPYVDIICQSVTKIFSSEDDKKDYIARQGWQARKSGIVLNKTITAPIESVEGLKTTFRSPFFDKERFLTWIKPLGSVMTDSETGGNRLKLHRKLDEGIPFHYRESYSGGGELSVEFRSEEERLAMISDIRAVLKKVAACVGCRACEAECTHGALTLERGKMTIDENKCVHCKKCVVNIDNGCWRYKSMYKSENEQKNKISNINCYNNFGLREKDTNLWISTLVDMRNNFFPWSAESHPLGKKMVEAASSWFQQSGLIEAKTRKVTALVDLFEKFGGDSALGWEFIWIALANNAILLKWFVTSTDIGSQYTTETLSDMLKLGYPELSDATIKGGLAALKDMITKSPVGDNGGMVSYEMKGKSVVSMKRLPRNIQPLTVLYSLYLIACLGDIGTFTVSGLMDSDIGSTYVSPLVAFGMSVTEFKRICEGLRSRYPDYIATTFTHGNDEVRVFPNRFNTNDIITLAIQEG